MRTGIALELYTSFNTINVFRKCALMCIQSFIDIVIMRGEGGGGMGLRKKKIDNSAFLPHIGRVRFFDTHGML